MGEQIVNYDTLIYEVNSDGVLLLTINRPDMLNAFTLVMGKELEDAFERVRLDDDIRAVVVTGAGRAFCAGMDLSREGNVFGLDETLKPTMDDLKNLDDVPDNLRDTGGLVNLAIHNCHKPVIGAINGAAIGFGATITLAMDIRFASKKAKFGFVFATLGITVEACSTWFLPRIVGMSQALEWTMTGDIFGAQEALDGGLVKELCEPEDVVEKAMALATKIAKNTSAVSVAATRRMMLLNSQLPTPADAHKVETLTMFYTSMADGKEGVQAFIEKRKPVHASLVSKDLPPITTQDGKDWWK